MEAKQSEQTAKLNKRRTILVGLAVCALAVVGAAAFWPGEREPEYQGKKLSEWLAPYQYDLFSHTPGGQRDSVEKAVRQMGTNALPFLIKWLDIDLALGKRTYRMARMLPVKITSWKPLGSYLARPFDRFEAAKWGFSILGSKAYPAIPDLARLVGRPKTSQTSVAAINILYCMGAPMDPAGQEALQKALLNPKADRVTIVRKLGTAVSFGYEPSNWVAGVACCATDGDQLLAVESVKLLQSIYEIGVYDFHERSGGSHWYVRTSRHKDTIVPALERALQHPDQSVRTAVTNALVKVAPEIVLSEWEIREREARGEMPMRKSKTPTVEVREVR